MRKLMLVLTLATSVAATLVPPAASAPAADHDRVG